jgi:hypothetical protein
MNNNDFNEIEVYSDFQELRGISKTIQQLSFRLKELEQKFPPDTLSKENQIWFIKTYIAVKFDLGVFVEKLNHYYKKYGNKNTQ